MSQPFDQLMFSVMTGRMRALNSHGAQPHPARPTIEEIRPLLQEAENNLRKARDLYCRADEILRTAQPLETAS